MRQSAERLGGLDSHRTMIGGIGFAQQRETVPTLLPIEIAAVDDGPADQDAMGAGIHGC
jgi:hypothetical protein